MNDASAQLDVACIVLAAGYSKRFGSDKRQALLPNGKTVLDATLASIPNIFCQRLLVLHEGDENLAHQHASWIPVVAVNASSGMGHSVASGISALGKCKGVLIALADMPTISGSTYSTVANLLTKDKIIVPCLQGQCGNPVALGADFFPELAALEGDNGARTLMQKYQAAIVKLELDDPGILRDIDTPADFTTN